MAFHVVTIRRMMLRLIQKSPGYAPYLLAFGVLVLAGWTVWLALLLPVPDYGFSSAMANLWFGHLSPVLVAITFWLPGVMVFAYARSDRQATMFFLFCQGMAMTLIAGTQSAMNYSPGQILFLFCIWWVGPLAIHTQMALTAREQARLNRRILMLIYSAGLALFCFFLITQRISDTLFFLYRRPLAYAWLALCLGLTFVLLVRRHMLSRDAEVRRNATILMWSNILGFSPMLALSLLPTLLFETEWLPFQASFFFLLAVPAGYSYAILRYRLVHLQRYIDRSAAYSLIVLVVGGVYGACYLAFSRLLPNVERLPLLVEMSLAVILIFAVQPLYRWLLAQVNRTFYGAWYDDRAALMRISQSLGEASTDPAGVAGTLCQVLEKTISAEYARLMLTNGAIVTGRSYVPCEQFPANRVKQVLAQIQQQTGREMGSYRDLEKIADLNVQEKAQIFGEKPRLWLLLQGSQGTLGLLVLGPRHGGEFDPDSLEMIELLARQAKIALENVALLTQVRAGAEQITRLHRQLIQARESERAGLARELHDETIQSLYGVNYQISALKSLLPQSYQHALDQLRGEVSHILDEVRSVCTDLRPPALDSLGIIAAVQAHIRKVRRVSGLRITFQVEGNEHQDLPEEIAMTLYRVLQESLSNAVKHAQASTVRVVATLNPDSACLSIMDDGKGFELPQSLETFTRYGHFGLAGMRERVELMGGQIQLETAPGCGCKIHIRLPLSYYSPTIPRQQEGNYAHSNLGR